MSVYDKIENIRRKPPAVRRQLVFVLSASITLLIFIAWGVNMSLISGGSDTPAQVGQSGQGLATTSANAVESSSGGIQMHLDRVKAGGTKVVDSVKSFIN